MVAGTAPTMTASYNPATNRQYGEQADANGNIGGYVYDIENRISQANSVAYSYAPGNQRIYKQSNGTGEELTFYGISGQKLATYSFSFTASRDVQLKNGS